MASLSSHILCKAHNNLLSPIDEVASYAIKSIRDAVILQKRRSESHEHSWPFQVFNIANAIYFERWFVKTAINLMMVGVGCAKNSYQPSKNMVEIVFGRIPIEKPKGLYAVATIDEGIRDFDMIQFAPIFTNTDFCGALFKFRDFRFVLWLAEHDVPSRMPVPSQILRDWPSGHLIYRIGKINWNLNDIPSHVIEFDWGNAV